jgi:hypothetical protein
VKISVTKVEKVLIIAAKLQEQNIIFSLNKIHDHKFKLEFEASSLNSQQAVRQPIYIALEEQLLESLIPLLQINFSDAALVLDSTFNELLATS